MTVRTTVVALAISIISLQCAAQVSKVSSENIMDVVFDMKKASEAVDKLASDMSKYCRWGIASLDTSDLDVAISRFLLNHGSQVPETVLASKMWRVSSSLATKFIIWLRVHHSVIWGADTVMMLACLMRRRPYSQDYSGREVNSTG